MPHEPPAIWQDADGKWYCRVNGEKEGPYDLRGFACSRVNQLVVRKWKRVPTYAKGRASWAFKREGEQNG